MISQKRFLAPEVVQSSAMDCGPASLKCLLEGFDISASYGRLREACQTDVDGTSLSAIQDVAQELGLEAEQIMLPLDHVLISKAKALPAIIVVKLANGITHSVVAWNRHGPLVQVMDPASGRRWPTCQQFLRDIHVHSCPVPAAEWREWAGSEEFLAGLRSRLSDLGLAGTEITPVVERAVEDPNWRSLGSLDAATRMVDSLVRCKGLRRGPQATAVLHQLLARPDMIDPGSWSVRPSPEDPEYPEYQLLLLGAVLVRVRGKLQLTAEPDKRCPEVEAIPRETPERPTRELIKLVRSDGLLVLGGIMAALMLAAGGVVLEALLFRGLLDLGRELGLAGQRIAAVGMIIGLLLLFLFLELPLDAGLLRLGRHLEIRLRQRFLYKIPRLGDRFLQSRLNSDMAQRSHSIHGIRFLPSLAGGFLSSVFELILVTVGIAWLDAASAGLAVLTAAACLGLALAGQSLLGERELRLWNQAGALCRFYLDALLGLVPIRVHGAEKAIRAQHKSLLSEWTRTGYARQRLVAAVDTLQMLVGFGLATWLLIGHLARNSETGAFLLLIYWTLRLPSLGQEVAALAWQYPACRSVTLRLFEPLLAPEETGEQLGTTLSSHSPGNDMCPLEGPSIAFEQVRVQAGENIILDEINVSIPAGSHIAIVGPSGAGKSTFVGLLLGWHRPAAGRVLVDGRPLDRCLAGLRRETAWVDPSVRLWNRAFIDNLTYGTDEKSALPVGVALQEADLRSLLERLPDGMQTSLGEGGALLSGGEGQRVRLARAMLRPRVRLVILDEAFCGLDQQRRRELLSRARRLWRHATLICVTHDLDVSRTFERVLVMEKGRIVEDGTAADLAGRPNSCYRAMLEEEQDLENRIWRNDRWRHLRLEQGKLYEIVGRRAR